MKAKKNEIEKLIERLNILLSDKKLYEIEIKRIENRIQEIIKKDLEKIKNGDKEKKIKI